MKKVLIIFGILQLLCVSCKEKKAADSQTSEMKTEENTQVATSNDNVLCNINGAPWSYTEASGVLVDDKNRGIRVLTLTFTKYLNPGKEHLSLSFDEATKELFEASVQIKQPGKDGQRIHAIYLYNERTAKSNPKGSISGQVTLDHDVASGTAQLQNLHIQYEGSLLANEKDTEITVTDLSFNNIAFSDVKKEMEAIFKNSK
ncbi:hypothetical protein [Flavobacterium sp. ASW18X]|uniref:hypothetical protein n=1 Tax=Flavobacterium sp. ASW18X TaxID=2572595 RepID=UPI0010AE4C38|nr:hypothetical protein [Flavobacterium sp. ASW18X]TKD60469.1 hypothetical protein FBT53_12745 [Flavobacterium sp. ASW18X]